MMGFPIARRGSVAAALLGILACGGGNDGGLDQNGSALQVRGGGDNVPDRYTSDLWVHGAYAYTGTWGAPPDQQPGDVIKIWSLDASGAPTLADSLKIPSIRTVSDVQVSADGALLVFSTERGANAGLYVYGLADPLQPVLQDSALVAEGIHTATVADIAGGRYVFAAKNPKNPALLIYDISTPAAISLAASVPIPPLYGIHDTYVRDGLAFVFAWNSGVIIYDVGNGMLGGSPRQPKEVSRVVPDDDGVAGGVATHNGWWFHNPVSGENRYLFVGQEGAQVLGAKSSGDIHVIDVQDLFHPREVAFFHLDGAGTHNFWMDEQRQILYAAYYNAGVVALDVSGLLAGDLAGRLIGRVEPGGPGDTYTWGVQLQGHSLYASDMLSGLWQLQAP
jgi:hypothetical protein